MGRLAEEEAMADVTFSDGREITLDMLKVSIQEYRKLFDKSQDQSEEDEVIARVAGMTADELRALPYPDWRVLVFAFFEKARNPLAEKN